MVHIVQTDDDARAHTYTWLGPADLPIPLGGARQPAIMVAVLFIPAAIVAVWQATSLIAWAIPGPAWAVSLTQLVVAVLGGTWGAVWLIRKAGRHLTRETPLVAHVANWQGEANTPRPAGPGVVHTITTPDLWAPTDATVHTITTTYQFEE